MPTTTYANRTLDARPDRVDLRDRSYQPRLRSLPLQYPPPDDITRYLARYEADGMILDQGSEGACTGFGLAAVVNYLRWKMAVDAGDAAPDKVSERMLYHLARFYDEWPGEDYEGSSCRGAMKGWQRHGVCSEGFWRYRDADGKVAFVPPESGWNTDAATRPLGAYYRIDKNSITDMQAALVEVGAIYASASVHEGWFLQPVGRMAPIGLPVIEVPEEGANVGGHAFALVGYTREGFVIQNSWGPDWGMRGFAILPFTDWVQRGSDAWVAVMGAPMEGAAAPRYHVPVALEKGVSKGLDRVPIKSGAPEAAPARREVPAWTTEQAYAHSIVMGNNGIVLNRSLTASDGLDCLRQALLEEPRAWLAARGARHVAIYAHGGLNSEEGALDRVRLLGPYFEANGIYPIFLVWRTGFLESLAGIVGDEIHGIPTRGIWSDLWKSIQDQAREARDRAIEVACQELLVRAVWSQMKQNAQAAAREPRPTLGLAAEHLRTLVPKDSERELHLIGHSAGAILLGHFLDLLPGASLSARTCSLFAPACTVRFALDHYLPAIESGVLGRQALSLDILSDERELGDSVGPYGKSLLYLVSRALEDRHKTPILGMASVWTRRAGDATTADALGGPELAGEVDKWLAFWGAGNRPRELSAPSVSNGPASIPSAHGCFDNDRDTITRTLARILGRDPKVAVSDLQGF
ncbi:MAG TPA: C1 family peptidase [Methylomirabilota bacterium]|nr:C1 family peptidase [Methylomirabilota bacterium]